MTINARRGKPHRVTDRFFTRREVAAECLRLFRDTVEVPVGACFVEPSAGGGAFFDLLARSKRVGLDLEPRHGGVPQADFFSWTPPEHPCVVVGNPPFGKRGRLAVRFVARSLAFAESVGMILPMTFTRYETHRLLPADARLALSVPLPPDSFELPNGEAYEARTVFQVWTTSAGEIDLRLRAPLPTKHPDFDMWQYNNTPEALRYFDEPFEFAVPCQGWQDYSRRETNAERCEKSKQWMLLRPLTDWARSLLWRLDYHRLAHEAQTATPGFRKGTLVHAYEAEKC